MANFKIHLFVAASASSIATASLYNSNQIELLDSPWFIFLGTTGGLLPDIDSDNSRPLILLFTALATLVAIVSILAYKDQYALQHLALIACVAFITVRYLILQVFRYYTVHRGVFHSLLSAACFTLLTVYISHTFFHSTRYFSWISGGFVGFGFIIHLLLDECYSVDLGNVQLKRSFGTALKLFSLKYLFASLLMFAACALLYVYTPAYPFRHQDAFTMINLAFEETSSTLEKYFFKLDW